MNGPGSARGDLAHARQRTCENGAGVADRDIPAGEHEGAHAGFLQGNTFELAVTDTLVARENDPTLSASLGEPLFVGSAFGEMIRQPLDGRTGIAQCRHDRTAVQRLIEKKGERLRRL